MERVTKTEVQHYASQLQKINYIMPLYITQLRMVNEFTLFNHLTRMGITA